MAGEVGGRVVLGRHWSAWLGESPVKQQQFRGPADALPVAPEPAGLWRSARVSRKPKAL